MKSERTIYTVDQEAPRRGAYIVAATMILPGLVMLAIGGAPKVFVGGLIFVLTGAATMLWYWYEARKYQDYAIVVTESALEQYPAGPRIRWTEVVRVARKGDLSLRIFARSGEVVTLDSSLQHYNVCLEDILARIPADVVAPATSDTAQSPKIYNLVEFWPSSLTLRETGVAYGWGDLSRPRLETRRTKHSAFFVVVVDALGEPVELSEQGDNALQLYWALRTELRRQETGGRSA